MLTYEGHLKGQSGLIKAYSGLHKGLVYVRLASFNHAFKAADARRVSTYADTYITRMWTNI